ncbi:hypothetical protein K438DRAFT_1987125 [Mycena galopus ATCC 62051]|nr:hypothetical protein K438DRAFT_1987125 [Mycena galopus ATCC 62051]
MPPPFPSLPFLPFFPSPKSSCSHRTVYTLRLIDTRPPPPCLVNLPYAPPLLSPSLLIAAPSVCIPSLPLPPGQLNSRYPDSIRPPNIRTAVSLPISIHALVHRVHTRTLIPAHRQPSIRRSNASSLPLSYPYRRSAGGRHNHALMRDVDLDLDDVA